VINKNFYRTFLISLIMLGFVFCNNTQLFAASNPATNGSIIVVNYESPHNYTNNALIAKTITASNATKMRVHFSKIQTEKYYDYVYTSAGDSWSGTLEDVWSEWYYGNTMKVSLITDGSTVDYGFKIDRVEYYISSETNWKSSKSYNISKIFYSNNENQNWTISESSAKAIRVHFKEIDLEQGYDFVTITSNSDSKIWPDKIHGTRTGVWSSWFPGNSININFMSDGSTTKRGFIIDSYEYMTTSKSDFPWTDLQFNTTYADEINPDYGDGGRRIADRLNHLPDWGQVTFSENSYSTKINNNSVENRSVKVEFKWSPKRLRNLVRDGNETYEFEIQFHNQTPPSSPSYGRPISAFKPWLITFDPHANNTVTGSGTKYEDTWHTPTYIFSDEQADRGTYFYFTNLPTRARYADTLWSSIEVKNDYNFAIGIKDAQCINPNVNYYYEIIGAKNANTNSAVFGLAGQRGYNFDHASLPAKDEYYVFNEEYENSTSDGNNEICVKYANYTMAQEGYWKLHEIISQKDSRDKLNMLCQAGRQFSWNSNGDISYRNNSSLSWSSSGITRNWSYWNDSWLTVNTVLGPKPVNK